MTWLKTVRKIGDSIGIIFNREEARNHNLKEGTIIDLTDIIIKNRGKK